MQFLIQVQEMIQVLEYSKGRFIQDVGREIPIYPDTVYRPPPKPVQLPIPKVPRNLFDIDPEINMDFEEKLTIFNRV